ncbi:MAG: hypothetical protein RI913_731, partial [Pseudomonadota bacterium]
MKNTHDILASEITPKNIFEKRRQLIKLAAMGAFGLSQAEVFSRNAFAQSGQKLPAKVNPQYFVADKLTSYKDVTTYNNFFEFGTDKADPARN